MDKSISYQTLNISNTNARDYFLLFIIWPFLALVSALSNYRQKEAKNIVYLFLIYYGFTYVIGQEGMDASEYVRRLQLNATLPFSDFFKIVGGLYSSDNSVDIVEPFISFVISRFTNQHYFLFGTYAALFGFFYLKSINLLHDLHKDNRGWNSGIFLIYFILIIPITSINGFRMWTAAWIFFYGAYNVILFRDKRYILVTLGACSVHWSFLIANVVLVLFYFLGNRNMIYFPLAISSFILPNALSSLFHSMSLKLGGALQNRYSGYTEEEYVLGQQESWQNASWFMSLSKDLIFYYLIFAVILIFLMHRKIMNGRSEKNLFGFLLLFLSFTNFAKAIPNFGTRFQIIFMLFATLYIFIYFLKIPGDKISIISLAGLFPMALYTAVEFRIGSEGINSWIFSPLFGMPLIAPGISLADFLFH